MKASSTNLALIGLGCIVAGPLLTACGHDQIDRTQGDVSIQGNDSGGGRTEAGSGGDADQNGSGGGGNRADGLGASNTGGAATDENPAPTNPPPCLSRDGLEREKIPPYPGTMTLTRDKVWVLDDFSIVRAGEVLTIEPCTRIEALDHFTVLVIGRGGQIIAKGTPNEPILFTSAAPVGERKAGDWGGVVIQGRAPTNQGDKMILEGFPIDSDYFFGGAEPDDDSGVMAYVRIEYAGIYIQDGNKINALTLAGVGAGTEIHHVMVAHALDDCFEWFGGTVDAHHLVAFNCDDDMFDVDWGYTGELSTLFGRVGEFDSSDPNGWECDNAWTDTTLTPGTNVTSSKVTLCGPGPDDTEHNISHGALFRRGCTGAFSEQVIMGFNYGVSLRDPFDTQEAPSVVLTNSLFFDNFANNIGLTHASNDFDPVEWFNFEGRNNLEPDPLPFTLADCRASGGPNAAVTSSGIGAFAEESDWLDGAWVSWEVD